jgi:hypothetical protein
MKKYSFLIILLYFILLIKLDNCAKLKDNNKFLNSNNVGNTNDILFNKTMNLLNETMVKMEQKVDETINLDKAVML